MFEGRVCGSTFDFVSEMIINKPNCTHLIVDQAPLLEKRMDSHDSANITGKISAASSHSQVFNMVQAIGVNHEISVVLVDRWSLAAVASVEKLAHGFLLDRVNLVHIKPTRVAW